MRRQQLLETMKSSTTQDKDRQGGIKTRKYPLILKNAAYHLHTSGNMFGKIR